MSTSLPDDLRALAEQMRNVSARIEARARKRDQTDHWRDAYRELQRADEMMGAARMAEEWALVIESEDAPRADA